MKVVVIQSMPGRFLEAACVCNDDVVLDVIKRLRDKIKDNKSLEVTYITAIPEADMPSEVEYLIEDGE